MASIIEFYNQYNEDFRFQRNSRKIEFITTLNALAPFTSTPSMVIELGAGSGAYSLHYANQGSHVTAVDLVPFNIEQIEHKKALHPHLSLKTVLADASNLTDISDATYDLTLCFGPYYHIINDQIRKRLIEESLRVLKPNGILAIAYLNKHSVMPMLIKKEPTFFNPFSIEQVMNKGFLDGSDTRSFWIDSHYTAPQEVEDYINQFNVDIIDHLATDGLSHTLSDEVDQLTEEQFQLYCQYHESTCRQPSILGISAHGLIIVRKK